MVPPGVKPNESPQPQERSPRGASRVTTWLSSQTVGVGLVGELAFLDESNARGRQKRFEWPDVIGGLQGRLWEI